MPRPFDLVVCTLGVSSTSAFNVLGRWGRDQGLFVPGPRPPEGVSESAALTKLDTALQHARLDLDPHKIGAELSVLWALRQHGRLGPAPRVVIVGTKTFGGEVAWRLTRYAARLLLDIELEASLVPDLDVSRPVAMQRGLGAFLEKIGGALDAGDPAGSCVAPVGGYKILTSLATQAAGLYAVPAFYLYEDGQVLHQLPTVPLRISAADLATVAGLMVRAEDGVHVSPDDAAEVALVAEFRWLFETADDGDGELLFLNALGRLLRKLPLYAHLFQVTLLATPAADRRIRRHERLLSLVWKLLDDLRARSEDADRLRHERDFGYRDAPFHVYKSPRTAARLVYRWEPSSRTLWLRHLWTDHDAYERELGANPQIVTKPFVAEDFTVDLLERIAST